MNDIMNISQIIRTASTIYIATRTNPSETSSLLPIQLITNGQLYLGIPSDKPIYQEMKKRTPVIITTSKDGSVMQYSGLPVFEKKDEISKLVLENNPTYKAIYSGKKKQLKMFYLENAKATLSHLIGEEEGITYHLL